MITPRTKPKRNMGARANIPSWLADPEGVAPCICGAPMVPGQPYVVAEGDLGFKRWFHAPCWAMIMEGEEGEEDWDDWE